MRHTHAQAEYHRRPCEATAAAMDEARAMVSDGINVLSGTVPPETLARYTHNDDGIYGCPSGSERAFTREMLNLRPLDPLEEPAPPMIATPEFLAQQMNRCSVEPDQGPPGRRTAGDPTETPSHIPTPPPTPHSGKYMVWMTQTQVWQAEAFADTPEEAKRKAYGSTRGWTAESDSVVLEAAIDIGAQTAEAKTGDQRDARRLGPGSGGWGTVYSRHLTDIEQGTTAAFPEVTGDGAGRSNLSEVNLASFVTAQQARSLGITPATAAKLKAFLQWSLDRHTAAVFRHADDPDAGHGTELYAFCNLAHTALDVAHGRMPLWALGKYTNPLYDTTEQLFTPEEISLAQPHFDVKVANYLIRSPGEPADLSRFDSRITEQQARRIGITMDTAAKLSALIDDASERRAVATEAYANGQSTAATELKQSLCLRTAGVNVACGQAPLSTLASYRQASGCGERLFNSSEITRARIWSIIRHPATPPAAPRQSLTPTASLRQAERAGAPPPSLDPLAVPHHGVWVAAATGTPQGMVEGPLTMLHLRARDQSHAESPTPPSREHALGRAGDPPYWTNTTDRPIPDPHGNGVRIGESKTPARTNLPNGSLSRQQPVGTKALSMQRFSPKPREGSAPPLAAHEQRTLV